MTGQVNRIETLHPGVREHFHRATLFWESAINTTDVGNRFRLLMAALYSCRAIVELMLEQADRGMLTVNRDELKSKFVTLVPYVNLIERVRIHDFHRYGLLPPNPRMKTVMAYGPTTLTASRGTAALMLTSEGPRTVVTGNSRIKERRPVFQSGDNFFDEDTGQYVSIDQAIKAYLTAICDAAAEFDALHTAEGRNAYPTPLSEIFGAQIGLKIDRAEHAGGHRIHIWFNDGTDGVVDLSEVLDGPVFQPLCDVNFFKSFRIKGGSLAWENGADFAPEYLHKLIHDEKSGKTTG